MNLENTHWRQQAEPLQVLPVLNPVAARPRNHNGPLLHVLQELVYTGQVVVVANQVSITKSLVFASTSSLSLAAGEL